MMPDFAELTRSKPVQVAHRAHLQDRRPRQLRPHLAALDRRRPQAALPPDRLPSRQGRRPGARRAASSTTRTARRASRCSTTSTASGATSWRRTASRSATRVQSGPDAEIELGNCLPLQEHSARHERAQRRAVSRAATSRVARSAGAFCQLMAKEGDYAQLRLPSGEVRKFHVNCRAVDRAGGQHRSREHVSSARRAAIAGCGTAPQRARRRDESRRPSDGRRRGQDLGRPSSVLAVGQERQGTQDPHAQAERLAHRAPAEEVRERRNAWRVPSRRGRTSSTPW